MFVRRCRSIACVANTVPDGIAVDLLFAAQPFTGLEHHGLHILRGLHRVGASVDVLVPSDVVRHMGDALDGHRVISFAPVPRWARLGREQWSLPWRFGSAPRGLRLLHSVAGVAPLLSSVPLVLTVPDLVYRVRPGDMHPRARWYFGWLGPRSIRRARRVMVSSQAVCRQLIELYHIVPERLAYTPLCAESLFTPRPSAEVASVRKRFGLPEKYILYVGTVDPRKDLARLRAAYELLPPDLADDSALVFVGRTNRGAERLAHELRRPGTRGHVLSVDYVPRDQLPAIYSGAAIFVYPSRYEGFGLPVLEAMSCGAPVIVSSAEALSELVDDAGVVLRTESVEELTQAIERLLRFEGEASRLQAAGLKRATAFSVDRIGRETAEVYRQALAA
ncbi:MAG: glycosyltransferase family 4 protein [Chloroflexi bacterium]|nr:MAG: glycosyltransferase family 4 protein [Chloroflexota bacterium]TME46649.1 MAG: glycosyltransferase family 4 protein [Chloroflexota bacterium]